jgi:hypothetical protein
MPDDVCPECGAARNLVDPVGGEIEYFCRSFFYGTRFKMSEVCAERCETNELRARLAALEAVAEAARGIQYAPYLDDDVLNRHSATTIECRALRELFAALASLAEQQKEPT